MMQKLRQNALPLLLALFNLAAVYRLSLIFVTSPLPNDINAHLFGYNLATGETLAVDYSLCHTLLYGSWQLLGGHGAALCLTLFELLSIAGMALLLRRAAPETDRTMRLTLAVMLNLVTAIHAPAVQLLPWLLVFYAAGCLLLRHKPDLPRLPLIAAGLMLSLLCFRLFTTPLLMSNWISATVTPSVHHNPTYMMMKPAALLTLALFLQFYDTLYTSHPDWRSYAAYTLLLTVCTAIKPNFVVAFAPALLVVLILDFIRQRARQTLRQVLMGVSVFPSIGLCLYQAVLLYDGAPSTSSGLFLGFLPVLCRMFSFEGGYVYILLELIRSYLLAAALWFFGSRKSSAFTSRFALLFLAIASFEGLMLAENGYRFGFNNLFWTAHCGMAAALPLLTGDLLHTKGLQTPGDLLAALRSRDPAASFGVRFCTLLLLLAFLTGACFVLINHTISA